MKFGIRTYDDGTYFIALPMISCVNDYQTARYLGLTGFEYSSILESCGAFREHENDEYEFKSRYFANKAIKALEPFLIMVSLIR